MEHFFIDFGEAVLKINFERMMEGLIIRYTGDAYPVENRGAKETPDHLLFSFSFSREATDWETISDFDLKSDLREMSSMKEVFQEIVITGIKGYNRGEDFGYMPGNIEHAFLL